MARLPDSTALGNLPGVQPTGAVPRINLSELHSIGDAGQALGKGISAIGSGIESAGDNFEKAQKKSDDEANTLGGIQAQTDYLEKSYALNKQLTDDPDYSSTPQKWDEGSKQIINEASQNIPDGQFRQKWVLRATQEAVKSRMDLEGRVASRQRDEQLGAINDNITRQQQIYIDPNASDDARQTAYRSMQESLDMAEHAGLYKPGVANAKRREFLQGAQWAEGQSRVQSDPEGLIKDLQPIAPAAPAAAPGPTGPQPGMLEAGNIDLANRPVVKTEDGKIATVRSISANFDGKEVLIPTVSKDGKILTNDQAIEQYKQTGQHLGIFDTPENADAYGKQLSAAQGKFYGAQAPDQPQEAATPAPAPAPAPRDYGSLELPLTIPSFAKAAAFDRLEKSGVYEQLPKELQQKIKAGAEGDAPLSLTKADLDSIPAGPWKTIAKEMGLPEPKEAPAPAKGEAPGQTQKDVPGLAAPPASKASATNASPVEIAKRFEGLDERADRATIAAFIEKSAGKKVDPVKTAWCAAFVNAVLGESGREGTGSLMAKSFLNYGTPTKQPSEGDIVVLSRGDPNGPYGHVGFFVGRDADGDIKVLAGNQGNKVSIRSFSEDQVLGFRHPPEAGSATSIPGATKLASNEAGPGVPVYNSRYSELTPLQRTTLQKNAERQLQSQDVAQQSAVSRLMTDDVNSLRTSGAGVADLDPMKVQKYFGPKAMSEWQEKRTLAHEQWQATNDMPLLSNAEINARVDGLHPKNGPPENFTHRAQVYDEAAKEAQRILTLRAKDPAQAAMEVPAVATAYKGINPADPKSRQAAIDLNLTAQERFGIPEDQRTPATAAEAAQLGAPLRRMLPGSESETLKDVAQAVKDRYPDHADTVFEQVVRGVQFKEDVGRRAASVLKKLANDEIPTTADQRAMDQERELAAAKRAVNGTAPAAGPSNTSPAAPIAIDPLTGLPMPVPNTPPQPASPAATEAFANVPARAIQMLRANPTLSEAFDAKYGKGASKKVLELGVK